jgi:hypothetical protein
VAFTVPVTVPVVQLRVAVPEAEGLPAALAEPAFANANATMTRQLSIAASITAV